jgi:ketosteroid isomerase-like protein
MAHDTMSTELRQLIDKAAIREVIDRYWAGEDRNDVDLVLSAFTGDAVYGRLRGHDGIRTAMAGLGAYAGMHHVVSSQLIEVDGDTARADTMALGFCRTRDDGEGARILVRGLRYLDDLVRTDGGWKIRHRRGVDAAESGHDSYWQSDMTVVPYWGPHTRDGAH